MMSSKKILLTLSLIGLSLILVLILRPKTQESNESRIIISTSNDGRRSEQPSPFVGFGRIVKDEDGSLSEDLEHGYDLEPFKMVSDDEQMVKLMAYLANNRHLVQHPDVKIMRYSDAEDVFYFKEIKLFSALHIYDVSVSGNEIIAIEAITQSDYPTYKNSGIDYDSKNEFFPVSYGEIWIVEPNTPPYKISPENINAGNPCISGDGKRIAYTANAVDQTNSLINEFLVVCDLETGQSEHYNTPNMKKDHYTVAPIMWLHNDTVLRTAEDWGETGGHGQVGYIDFR